MGYFSPTSGNTGCNKVRVKTEKYVQLAAAILHVHADHKVAKNKVNFFSENMAASNEVLGHKTRGHCTQANCFWP